MSTPDGSATVSITSISEARRWGMLAASTFAQAAAVVANNGVAYLVPALHRHDHYSLAAAGAIVAAPSFGVMAALVAWGWLADHRGERVVLLAGLAATAAFAAAATQTHATGVLGLMLFLAGAGSAAANSASGRVVVGWFPPQRRGLAMGIRQMGQPMGMAIAAVAIALVAARHGVHAALWVPAIATLVAAAIVAVVVIDPPRPPKKTGTAAAAENPYRQDRYLARIHGVSVLLVVPQFVVGTFMLLWLTDSQGWSTGAAGALVAVANILGAFGRIAAGHLSDLVRSRMRPLQWVAIAACAAMILLGIAAGLELFVAVPLIVLASVLSVADNGLAFTAVAERAGAYWSGRALGVQNTAQFLTAALVGPIGGWAITHLGYAWTYALTGLLPLLAIGLVPVHGERRHD
ncbi:MAG: MFS transporter [Kineosporiaceae bacterium]